MSLYKIHILMPNNIDEYSFEIHITLVHIHCAFAF